MVFKDRRRCLNCFSENLTTFALKTDFFNIFLRHSLCCAVSFPIKCCIPFWDAGLLLLCFSKAPYCFVNFKWLISAEHKSARCSRVIIMVNSISVDEWNSMDLAEATGVAWHYVRRIIQRRMTTSYTRARFWQGESCLNSQLGISITSR